MKTAFGDVKYYGTTWIHFVLLLLVVVFDMQVTAQSETTIEPVIVPTPTCKTVWRRSPYCDEINECTGDVITPKCGQNCTAASDSFVCICNAGYRLSSDRRTCDDIDECKEKSSNCTQTCSNTLGNFTCNCTAGYRLAANGRSCDDIDECTERRSGCAKECYNTIGNYTCGCPAGYRLAADGRLCNDVDECANLVDHCTVPENSVCKNNIGSYRCVCKTGFEQAGPLAQCHDINECETANNCTLYENTTCENIIGSYRCRPNNRGISEAAKVAIPVTLCLVAVLVVIVIAVVCFVRRAKERKINEKGPAKNSTVTVASVKEHVYVNQAFDSAKGDSKSSRAQVSSEILYEECDDNMRNQVTNPNDSQMEFAEIVYEDFSNVPVTKTKPKPMPKPKPKLNDLSTQEQCCSTNVSSSDPGDGKADSKEAASGQTILTNIHKGIQRIFKFKSRPTSFTLCIYLSYTPMKKCALARARFIRKITYLEVHYQSLLEIDPAARLTIKKDYFRGDGHRPNCYANTILP